MFCNVHRKKTIMKRRKIVIIIILCFCVTGRRAFHSALHSDFASSEDKSHLDTLSRELYHTMQLQERQLLPLKEENVNNIAYQIGLVIGIMREKYKRIMDIYGEYFRRYSGQTRIVGPGVWELKPIHILIACNDIRMIEMEIYKYIDLLLKIHPDELEDDMPSPDQIKALAPGSGGPQFMPRSVHQKSAVPDSVLGGKINQTISTLMTFPDVSLRNEAQPLQNRLTQEDIKRQYRESYIKEHGLDTEWSLDHFYGFA